MTAALKLQPPLFMEVGLVISSAFERTSETESSLLGPTPDARLLRSFKRGWKMQEHGYAQLLPNCDKQRTVRRTFPLFAEPHSFLRPV